MTERSRHQAGDPIGAIPKPNKDVPYMYFGAGRELPRGARRRPRFMSTARPVSGSGSPWPKRRPSAEDVRVGDVIVGNVELRANCPCGHSKIVDAGTLRARREPTEMIRRLRFRCGQCRRFATLGHGVSMYVLNEGER
jgi:hypothetical protein